MANKRIYQLDPAVGVTDTTYFPIEDSSNTNITEKASGVQIATYLANNGFLTTDDIGDTVEGFDSTILKSDDIGVTVQGYDADILKVSNIGIDVQAWDSNLDDIVGLSQVDGNFIKSNGTTWISGTVSIYDVSGFDITAPNSGDVLVFNGTDFANLATGSDSGVQSWNANLDVLAALDPTTTGNVIISDGTNWISGSVSAPSTALDDLTDVAITSVTTNDVLTYDGTNWINAPVASPSLAIDDLSDVTITSVSSGDILYFDGTNFINAAPGSSSGVQPYDSSILTSSDIGSTVQAYDATILTSSDIGSTIEAYDATILKSGDIGSSVQAYDADLTTIAGLTPNVNDILRFNGTNWDNTPGAVNAFRQFQTNSNTSITLALSDANTYNILDGTASITVTVPANGSVAIPIGSEIEFFRDTSNTVTFASDGTSVIKSKGSLLDIADQNTAAVLKKVATNTWHLMGNLG